MGDARRGVPMSRRAVTVGEAGDGARCRDGDAGLTARRGRPGSRILPGRAIPPERRAQVLPETDTPCGGGGAAGHRGVAHHVGVVPRVSVQQQVRGVPQLVKARAQSLRPADVNMLTRKVTKKIITERTLASNAPTWNPRAAMT